METKIEHLRLIRIHIERKNMINSKQYIQYNKTGNVRIT